MKKLVIIPGGFHPFHAGHKALYDAARDAFPSADVYIAATADTSTRPFPFDVKKKLARIAGVDGHRFIQVKSPFRANEITQMYDPNETVLIFARSEKDREQQPQAGGVKKDGSASYLQPYKRNGLQPMSQHGYMVYLPTVQFGPGMTSGTEIRAKWPGMDPAQKVRLVQQLYPDTVQKTKLADVIVKMLDHVMGTDVDEGIGKALTTGALAGAMALGSMGAKAATSPTDPSWNKLAQQQQQISGQRSVSSDTVNDNTMSVTGPNAKGEYRVRVVVGNNLAQYVTKTPPKDLNSALKDPTVQKALRESGIDEAVLINDPDAGVRIQPAGGMGTWDESSLVSNLARKFADMVTMVKTKNYQGLHHVLYKAGVVESMVRALAEYQAFQTKQGRRPVARGKEIEMSDYLDEKSAGQ